MPETPFPDDGAPDSTLALLREGYEFLPRRFARLRTDAFRSRLMLRRATCVRGAEAAEMFYGGQRFTRRGAMPITVLKLLQDRGSVQTLDGAAHHHRKALFLSLTAPGSVARLTALAEEEWLRRLPAWDGRARVNLFDETRAILLRAACAWAGVPLRAEDTDRRLREISEMIEATGSVGPRNWRALLLRARAERWARGLVRDARARPQAGLGTPLAILAAHRDHAGTLLSAKVAAVELLNLLRPTVAVARFLVFAALALHRHPEAARRIREGDAAYLDAFAQEVRRHSPFFPLVGGRALQGFDWRGRRIAKGAWVLLDLYGTNRDPRLWDAPEEFRPERFLDRTPTPFDLVPQGGGDHLTGHRCPGEGITLALIATAARRLAVLPHEVPPQDLSVDLSRIPALPRSGFDLVLKGR